MTASVDQTEHVSLPSGALAAGQVLGGRYELWSLLGRGGMGVVWHAFDLKLRVEVALKALRKDLAGGTEATAMVRREVRAAREVMSPNVCRIFDLAEADGQELVSMEFVDGTTLLEVLREHGPLELQRARELAAQLLAGLEAIHSAGLVHRDVKPENIMVTRAGRVVLMDFGLAKRVEAVTGSVSGTPAYMAPEHGRGEAVDARADIYSVGVVLAEMVAGGGIRHRGSRESVWRGLRQLPPEVPEGPWAPVLARAVSRDPAERFPSAQALSRALEDATLRVDGAEDLHPYPGLASFTEADAAYFFGREAEVEALWIRLAQRHLLAVVGPSGAGKSSFLRAGLIPARPRGWGRAVCTPGSSPLVALAQALVPELSGDTEALRALVRTDDLESMVTAARRWRQRHDEVLLVVDQLEELFTLNPPEVQRRFVELLVRLALEVEVRVLLSLRDDFLFHCHAHPALAPMLDGLTLLGPPVGAALRRAVVQPALKCGYRFSDDALVDEMLTEVEGERGALPLLAFAAARLWTERDRPAGELTREAYEQMGGVAGALAQHAEATLERIGSDHEPLVRELFRNLVTAHGTRAARAEHELLSVFEPGDRPAAREVLDLLVDARLLTSFEVEAPGEEGETHRRIEIVHESLLSAWPRLVRWQTQDAEGAQLRDQLRQAARMWHERGRSDDLLWSGTAFKELQLWRERYPGGLSETEEAFAAAMVDHATRRRRRRGVALIAAMVFLAGLAVSLGGLWQRSMQETRRAEAARRFESARQRLHSIPRNSLAWIISSLELEDDPQVRRLAVRALHTTPMYLEPLPWGHSGPVVQVAFAPDGSWLASASTDGTVRVWPLRPDGGTSRVVFRADSGSGLGLGYMESMHLSPDGTFIAVNTPPGHVVTLVPVGSGTPREVLPFDGWIMSVAVGPHGRYVAASGHKHPMSEPLTRVVDLETGEVTVLDADDGDCVWTVKFTPDGRLLTHSTRRLLEWNVQTGVSRLVLHRDYDTYGSFTLSADGDTMLVQDVGGYWVHDLATGTSVELGSHSVGVARSGAIDPTGTIAVTASESAHDPFVQVGPVSGGEPHLLAGHQGMIYSVAVSPDGRWIASGSHDGTIRLWPMPDLSSPPLHTLPYEQLMARLRAHINYHLECGHPEVERGCIAVHDPFPGWESVPTW